MQQRYYIRTYNLLQPGEDRLLHEIETASGIYGTYTLGFGGRTYCDTFFNNDVRRWSSCFQCDIAALPAASKVIPLPCDTTSLIFTD